jgi:membrane associated rhomboid family serine protease
MEVHSGREVASLEDYDAEIKLRWWNYLSGFLGLPIEIRSPKRKRTPSVTSTLAAIIAGVSFSVYTFFPGIVTWLGFSSEFPFRFLGLTLITSFFLHAGLFHLLGNLYFLMTFGDNVEDFLGVRRFLLLLFGATVVGNVLQFTANPGSNMLLIGASGGIAGIVAFYGLQFRQARVAIFLLRIIPVKLRAVWALVLWFAFQLLGAATGWVNTDHTAYAAHLGGAATGLVLWRVWQVR